MSVVKEDLRRFGVREEDAEERVDGEGGWSWLRRTTKRPPLRNMTLIQIRKQEH